MFEIDGKVFRNIQEQVQKNKSDIAAIRNVETVLNEFGITVLGRFDTEEEIPEGTYNYGDTYLIGTEEPYDMYIFTRDDADGEFINIGPLNIVGPQGIPGPTGQTGATGETGPAGPTGNGIYTITKTDTTGNVDTYTISYTNGNSTTFTVTNGINGQNGADGDPGESFMIMGVINSTSLLPDPSTTPRNYAYVLNDGVSTTPDRLYYITGAIGSESWSYSSFAAAGTTVSVNGNTVYTFDADTKQDALVSGTNIKTINNQSLLGSGDINTNVKNLPGSGYYVTGDNVVSEDVYNLVKTSQYANLCVAINASGTIYTFSQNGLKNWASYVSFNWVKYTDHDALEKWVLQPLISGNNKILNITKYTFSMQSALPTTSTAGQVLTSTSTAGTVQWETPAITATDFTNAGWSYVTGGSYMWLDWDSTYQVQYRKTDGAGFEQIVSWLVTIPKQSDIGNNGKFEMHMVQFVYPATGLAMYQLSGSAQNQSSGQPLRPRFDISYVSWSSYNQQGGFVSVQDGTKYYRKIR